MQTPPLSLTIHQRSSSPQGAAQRGQMERGASIEYLSAFPAEAEFLYPPLSYLRPTGRTQELTYDGVPFKIVEVVPALS